MNCKPGDLARIVHPFTAHGVGRFVEVVRLSRHFERLGGRDFRHLMPGPGWVCRGNVPADDGLVLKELVVADECLRPIRDPGDDAVDESKAWLPSVPLPTIDPSLLPAKVHE